MKFMSFLICNLKLTSVVAQSIQATRLLASFLAASSRANAIRNDSRESAGRLHFARTQLFLTRRKKRFLCETLKPSSLFSSLRPSLSPAFIMHMRFAETNDDFLELDVIFMQASEKPPFITRRYTTLKYY